MKFEMFLHEAIVKVLGENMAEMTFQEIADEINRRDLYKKNDGTPVEAFQIKLRSRKRPRFFILNESSVGLIEWNQSTPTTPGQ